MQAKIRVGAVSYLNTKPLIYGFGKGMMKNEIDLLIDYPSRIADQLLNDEIDIGLVPVVVIPEMERSHIISKYCIGCDGGVGSVCLFSEVPLNRIKKVLLDYQSKTSAELLKIVLKDFWKISPEIQAGGEDYIREIKESTAGLVIGDRALEKRSESVYIYDLGLEWKKYTGLPFVFAAWISNKIFSPEFIKAFNEANIFGLQHISDIVKQNPYQYYDLNKYYTKNISYRFDDEKKDGLNLFLEKLQENPVMPGQNIQEQL
ncbi:menaquinone biosynthesis protein [soil metagenome]